MIPTVSLYVFKNRKTKRGLAKLYIRFTSNRKSSYKSTNVVVPFNMWDPIKQKVKSSYKLSNATNMLLERKISEAREELMHAAVRSKHISSHQAKSIVFNKVNLSFFGLVDEYLDNFNKQDKIGSYDKYKAIFGKFQTFLGNRSVSLHDIDSKCLLDFQYFLKTNCKNKVNTIHGNMRAIQRIFSIAVERNIISLSEDPFKGLKFKQEKPVRDFLTADEISVIRGLKLEEGSFLEKSRDMFIWTILCGGLRVADVLSLRKSNLNGRVMTLVIQKTKTPHRINLPDEGYHIIKRYLDKISETDGYIFGMIVESGYQANPKRFDQLIAGATAKYNLALKEIVKQAGINKSIASHQARISFVTNAAQSGIPLTTIQGILKHSKMDMTAHYSKFVDNQGDAALVDFEKKIIEK